MTFEHIVYIPFAVMVGLVFGYILGARAVRAEMEKAKKRARR